VYNEGKKGKGRNIVL